MAKILLTGGHAGTTAIAVVEELLERQKKATFKIYWIGAKSSVEGRYVEPIESQVFKKMGVYVYSIIAGRLQTKFTRWTIPSILKIPIGFINALFLLIRIKPNVILSFGGYLAVPVVVVGKILGASILVHEQTIAAGRANRFSGWFADKIILSRPESAAYFPNRKTVVSGIPLMKSIVSVKSKHSISQKPVLFITLGSRGSQVVNETIMPSLENLLSLYKIIHITGQADYLKFVNFKKHLSADRGSDYNVIKTVSPLEIFKCYKKADIVLSRGGANTLAEILSTRRPSVIIPLPFTYLDEQLKNARFAEKVGIAKVIEQKNLSPEKLIDELNLVRKNYTKMVEKASLKVNPDDDAAKIIADLIFDYSKDNSDISI